MYSVHNVGSCPWTNRGPEFGAWCFHQEPPARKNIFLHQPAPGPIECAGIILRRKNKGVSSLWAAHSQKNAEDFFENMFQFSEIIELYCDDLELIVIIIGLV